MFFIFSFSISALTTWQTTIAGIDEVMKEMTTADPVARLGAQEALEKISRVVNAVPPASLLIAPVTLQNS
jgi:hypothetical protein